MNRREQSFSFPWKLYLRWTVAQGILLIVVLTALGFAARTLFRQNYLLHTDSQLRDLLQVVSNDLPRNWNDDWCLSHVRKTDIRLNVVRASDGISICDSHYKTPSPVSLLWRPEIQEAIRTGAAGLVRSSTALKNSESIYRTLFISDRGVVLRAGLSVSNLSASLNEFDWLLMNFLVGAFALLLITSAVVSGRMVLPIGKILSNVKRRRSLPLGESENELVEIEKSIEDLQGQAEKVQFDFMVNASHELKTPLAVIKGFAETLLMNISRGISIDPKHVQHISNSTLRMQKLVDQMLDLAAIHSDQEGSNLQVIEVDTRSITDQVVEQLRDDFEKKRLTLHVDIRTPHVLADELKLEQVLLNLLGNAQKYSLEGTRVEVSWTNSPSNKEILLSVKNEGPVISSDQRQRLFERFYRLDKGRSSLHGGFGLGLAIVREIMILHGGTIDLESALNTGTTFICRFPVGALHRPADGAFASAP